MVADQFEVPLASYAVRRKLPTAATASPKCD
jgi:hypothetical protein